MKILLTVNPEGSTQIEVIGGDGKNCLKATEALEEALGAVKDREFKPEYRQGTQQINRLNQRQ
jgi:hypothetical protein